MTTKFLDSLVRSYATRNFSVAVEKGQFSLLNRSSATVRYPGGTVCTDFRLRTEFQVTGKTVSMNPDPRHTDYSGYNAECISDSGVFNPLVAISAFAKSDFGKRVIPTDIEAQIRALPHRDSHEAFLYNMMISWGRALMFSMSKREKKESDDDDEEKFLVRTSPYESSHYIVGLPNMHPIETEIELGPPCEFRYVPRNQRDPTNYFKDPYVLHYNASSPEQEWFYLYHVPSRTVISPLNFDIPTPGIDDPATITLDRVNPYGELDFDQSEEVPWGKPDILWMYIVDYVQTNRLTQQFAAVCETFGASCYHPMWSSAEACQWQQSELIVTLGTFSPTRARLRYVLTGPELVLDEDAKEYSMNVAANPSVFLIDSAISNYFMWYGLYAVLHNESVGRDAWRTVFTTSSDDMDLLYGPHMRAFVTGVVTGNEISTMMTGGAGMYINVSKMAKVTQLTNVVDKEDNNATTVLPINALYAPVSGSLILGTLAGDLDVVQHLKSRYRVDFNGTVATQYDVVEVLKTSQIYRLFGHNVVIQENITKDYIRPWAAVNECVIEPASIQFDPSVVRILTLAWSEERQGRHDAIPQLGSVAQSGYLEIDIGIPTIEPIKFRTPQTPLEKYVTAKRKPKPLMVKIKSSYSFTKKVLKARTDDGFKPEPPQDFQEAPGILPHVDLTEVHTTGAPTGLTSTDA